MIISFDVPDRSSPILSITKHSEKKKNGQQRTDTNQMEMQRFFFRVCPICGADLHRDFTSRDYFYSLQLDIYTSNL